MENLEKPNDKLLPGYTITEEKILLSMLHEIENFMSEHSWENLLPFQTERSFTLDLTGNSVVFVMRLRKGFDYDPNKQELNLYLKRIIKGTMNDKWPQVEGGFYLSIGNAEKILENIRSYQQDLSAIKNKLYKGYYSVFNY